MRSSPATGSPDRRPLDPWTTAAAMAAVAVAAAVAVLSGCVGAGGVRVDPPGGDDSGASVAAESHPVGGIAKGTVFEPFNAGVFTVDVPDGWPRTERANYVSYVDRLDLVTVEWSKAAGAPTTTTARTVDVPALRAAARSFTLQRIEAVSRPAGTGVEIAYLQGGSPDVVTGRTVVHAVERYTFYDAGIRVVLTLAGPKNADNSVPWRAITDSLRWVH